MTSLPHAPARLDAGPDPRRTDTAATVLRTILDDGPVARSAIARRAGLSTAAVSKQCAALAAAGLVRERPVRPPRLAVGRPHVPVDIDLRAHVVAGVHIAVPHVTLVVMDLRGRVVGQERIPHADPAAPAVLDAVATRMAAFAAAHAGGRQILEVGVATGGWIDPGRGVVVRHGGLGWTDVPVVAVLADRLGLPVRVESHARALAVAEQLLGVHRARARQSLVHLFVGNVVEAAIATGGRMHRGARSAAGGVAHLPVGGGELLAPAPCGCGRRGCLQATVSDRAVAGAAAAAGLVAEPHYPDVVAALEAGDADVLALYADRARIVGRAAAMLVDLFNPEVLVVTEAGAVRHPDVLAALRAEVARSAHLCDDPRRAVVASSFDTRSLAVAAGAVVLGELYARPLEVSRAA